MRPTTRTLSSTTPRTRRKPRSPFQWEHLDTDVADALEALWKGPPHAPVLTVYARPNAEPDKIYIAKWGQEYAFRFAGPFSALGKSGQAVFEEI